jgi:hypothetical protein
MTQKSKQTPNKESIPGLLLKVYKFGFRPVSSKRVVVPARPAKLHRLAESIPWNLFLGSLKVYIFGL